MIIREEREIVEQYLLLKEEEVEDNGLDVELDEKLLVKKLDRYSTKLVSFLLRGRKGSAEAMLKRLKDLMNKDTRVKFDDVGKSIQHGVDVYINRHSSDKSFFEQMKKNLPKEVKANSSSIVNYILKMIDPEYKEEEAEKEDISKMKFNPRTGETESKETTEVDLSIKQSYNNILKRYKNLLDIDLSYIKLKHGICINRDGSTNKELLKNKYQCGASITNNNEIYIGDRKHLSQVLIFYNLQATMTVDDLIDVLLAHELAHEVFQKHMPSIALRNTIVSKIKKLGFETVYTKYVKTNFKDKYDEELFCEYVADSIVKNKKPF